VADRPPPVLNYSSAAPVPPSFLATTAGILRHPSDAFRSEPELPGARRFARSHTDRGTHAGSRPALRRSAAESDAAAARRRTAVLLHCAHLLPPAVVILSTVLVYYRRDYSRMIRADELPYLILLTFELVMGAAYIFLTFRIASRGSSPPAS
jgi:hypothetical protein